MGPRGASPAPGEITSRNGDAVCPAACHRFLHLGERQEISYLLDLGLGWRNEFIYSFFE